MSGNSGVLNITLRVKDDGSVVVERFGKAVDREGDRIEKSMLRSGKAVNALKLGVTALGAASVVALKKAVDMASDLEEVHSKFGVVFKGQQDLVGAWAETLVDAYAMSQREAEQYLASIQDLLVPMGMASASAAALSNEVVKLAADLGSFNNQLTSKVMDDYQSALVGNYETMKKYGVVLNETTVQAKALEMGLAATKNELTAADKAQAAHQIILKSSAAAIGDMARTSDGYANTTKRLDSEWEDFAATMGEKFLPAATRVKGITADILDNLTNAIKGPGIDDQIAAAEARLAELMRSQEQKEKEAEQARMDAIERREQRRQSWIKRNAAPQDTQSAQILAAHQARWNEELQKSSEQLDLESAQMDLLYLKDLKRFQQMEKHTEKMSSMGGGTVGQPPAAGKDNNAHVKAYQDEVQRLMGVYLNFTNEYKRLTLGQYAFEKMEIEAAGREFKAAGADKIQVARWVAEQQRQISRVWYDGATRELDDYALSASNAAANTAMVFSNAFSNMENAIVSFVTTGKASFSDLVNSMIADIIRLAARQAITAPLASALAGGMASFFGGWGGTGTGSYTSGDGSFSSTFATYNAHGNVFGAGGLKRFAKGGVFTNGIYDRPTPFLFGSGGAFGVMGEAGTEGVLPLARTKNGDLGVTMSGGGAPVVNVIINNMASNAKGTVTGKMSNASGGFDLMVLIDQVDGGLANRAAAGRSSFGNVLETQYGLNRAYGAMR